MKKYKKIIAILLSLALIISTFGIFEVSAATKDTRYSPKYLQNGGFEENADKYKFSSNYTQPFKADVPYWDTTAYGNDGTNGMLEFFKAGAAHFNRSNTVNKVVAQGEVAAELNADEISTIYQRIETVSGSTYTWGLDHRGRDTTDTMVLFIGPEQYKTVDGVKTAIDPSKPNKTGKDQFVKMTDWLKTQYGISYPAKGCSQKYTIYSKPFAANGAFQNESTNANENFSMTKTDECNQEWNLWVISSEYENKDQDPTKAIKGWSKYGTNRYNENDDSYNDVINGAGSKLGYDCTYTVPKGQTKTLFAFTSYSGGRLSGGNIIYDATFGNLLDDINFKLYQPISSSITEGGNGGVHTGNATITSDIKNGNLFYSTVTDGELCTIRTMRLDEKDKYEFQGAYVTVYKDDGTPVTRYIPIYNGDISKLNKEEKLALSKDYFLTDGTTTIDENGVKKTWDYYFNVSVESPVHIHMMYSKAPYVLYDSNGGEPYRWVLDNSGGGNLIGFRDNFQTVEGLVGTGSYYQNCIVKENTTTSGLEVEQPGFYKSHDAVPNEDWNKNTFADGSTVGASFLGWAIKDSSNNLVILNGKHQVTYNPKPDKLGHVTFNNLDENGHIIESGAVAGLELDATHGVTLTAQWQFGYTAQAQTLLGHALETQSWENSDVGGWVEETFINDRSNVTDHKEAYTPNRTERTDAYGAVGEKIIFRATPDAEHNYVFDGWYTKEADGTYKLVTTAPILAISVEEGKSTTYYARFKTKTVPVIFHYSASGASDGYDYYLKDANNKYGKYFQDVVYNEKAKQPPTNLNPKVTMWFTSPTERDQEHLFDFSTKITEETHLYASPMFNFNYYTGFSFTEPWTVECYATLLLRNDNNTTKFVDMKSDSLITDFNTYMLTTSNYGNTAPKASEIKKNANTVRVGKNKNNSLVLYNNTTNTQVSFNRCGARLKDAYIFNMHIPTWVVFDFTYNGITYTSAIVNRCLYNEIDIYMKTENNGYFTTFPKETQAVLRTAQTELLNSIRAMNEAIAPKGITEPTEYKEGVTVTGLTVTEDTVPSANYTFNSTTAIRNIEPWGFKYSFNITETDVKSFSDYGAVVLTDANDTYIDTTPTIYEILKNSNSLLYSKSMNNYYTEDGSICVHHVNGIKATDFEKKTYAVFFVKDSNGEYHYSEVITNSYNTIASNDTSDETREISKSIKTYSEKLIAYYKAKKDAASLK